MPDLQLGPAGRFASNSRLFFPAAALLDTILSKEALQVKPRACQRHMHLAPLAGRVIKAYRRRCPCSVALQVLDAIMRYSDRQSGSPRSPPQSAEVLQWASCIDDGDADGRMAVDALTMWLRPSLACHTRHKQPR